MDVGLLSLAAGRLAEMNETDAENEITSLRPDELTSLVRYYNKKDRERLKLEADVEQYMSAVLIAIRRQHRTRSPRLELVSIRPCKKQSTNAETALEIESTTRASRSIAPANSGQDLPTGSSSSTNNRSTCAEDRAEGFARIGTQSITLTSRAKLSIPGALVGTRRTREQPLAHVLWIPDSNGHWSWVCHDKLPSKVVADLVQLIRDKIVDTRYKREDWARMIKHRKFYVGKHYCISEYACSDYGEISVMAWEYSEDEENRACDRCTDARRPCLRLVRLDDPAEVAVSWLPLPDRYRDDASPESKEFWVKKRLSAKPKMKRIF
ncbi:hypothetical protein HBI37_165990 [Parastagonospora nodorum]|nr:hypothetical protein HBI37_165990 [Parastagonospora nodorum]KAH6345491.1 hypothetical protein HBI36_159170 [Parastagonospora nodorum]